MSKLLFDENEIKDVRPFFEAVEDLKTLIATEIARFKRKAKKEGLSTEDRKSIVELSKSITEVLKQTEMIAKVSPFDILTEEESLSLLIAEIKKHPGWIDTIMEELK